MNLRVDSGRRGRLAGHSSPRRNFFCPQALPAWGHLPVQGPPGMGACHLKASSRPFIYWLHFMVYPNGFPVTQTIRPVLPCETSKDKSNSSFHVRHSNMLQWVVGPPLSLLFFGLRVLGSWDCQAPPRSGSPTGQPPARSRLAGRELPDRNKSLWR